MWKKLPLKIREKAIIVIRIFAEDPTHISLHNHALVGQYIGFRSIDVTGDYRIIFRELSDGTYELVEMVKIGTHSQLY